MINPNPLRQNERFQMFWLSPALLVIGLVLLGGASGIVISNIVAISEKRRLKKSVLSFLLIAFSTSLPELSVAVNSIVIGNMAVSLGDILGSNITNIALIIGMGLIVVTLTNSNKKGAVIGDEEKREFTTGLMLLSVTLLLLLYLQYISRFIGVLLLCIFFGYSFILIRKRKEKEDITSNNTGDGNIKKDLVLLTAGIAGIIIGARLTIDSAIDIASYLGIASSIIGATLVAFGTSLPELIVDVRAAYRGHFEIAMGDIVGSCFLNSTLILGLLLTFTLFKVNLLVVSDLILFSVVSNLLLWYFLDSGRLNGREGLILLALYLINLLTILGILVLKVP
jgi:cation:H+ antiporter